MRILRACMLLLLFIGGCSPNTGPVPPTPTSYNSVLPLVVQPPEATQTPLLLEVLPSATPEPSATPTLEPTATALPRITLLFTGVIVPARCVQSEIDARNDANYVYTNVRKLIKAADLAVGTLNATLSDYPPHTGCRFTYVLVGDSRSAAAAGKAGFDLMSVATNHIKNCGIGDCGDRAFLDTLDNLRANGVLPVGAGNNLAEALQPVVVEVQGVRFGFVSLGMVEPMTYAGETTPGTAILNDEYLRAAIAEARKQADVVIAMPHWGPEDTPDPNDYQLRLGKVAAEAGADVVVGNHTHVVQAIERINGIDVFYGLGNFIFDQTWDLAHQQGVILLLNFEGSQYKGYELIPTHVDGDGTVHLAEGEEAAQILERIEEASQRIRR
jgi:poly-gamma-glutamate synthesis protein (capsule biosynthesis protein)